MPLCPDARQVDETTAVPVRHNDSEALGVGSYVACHICRSLRRRVIMSYGDSWQLDKHDGTVTADFKKAALYGEGFCFRALCADGDNSFGKCRY